MEYSGASAYNDDQFFKNYINRRNCEESPNNIIEKPILLEMIGDVKGKNVLDLGAEMLNLVLICYKKDASHMKE